MRHTPKRHMLNTFQARAVDHPLSPVKPTLVSLCLAINLVPVLASIRACLLGWVSLFLAPPMPSAWLCVGGVSPAVMLSFWGCSLKNGCWVPGTRDDNVRCPTQAT